MRIAILIDGFPPRRTGGAQTATVNVARELAQRGHEVRVITTEDKDLRGVRRPSGY